MKRFIMLTVLANLLFLLPASPLSASEAHFLQPVELIIIDAGHGGIDPGATAVLEREGERTAVYEKELNLALALLTAERITAAFPDIRVLLTREDDRYISLEQRSQAANRAVTEEGKSKIFISFHANSAEDAQAASGFELWLRYPSRTYDFFSPAVAEAGIEVAADTANSQLNRELDRADRLLSESILLAMEAVLGSESRNRGIKYADFHVLMNTFMPAVLIETGFMSNPAELEQLISEEYRTRIADAVLRGISLYLAAVE